MISEDWEPQGCLVHALSALVIVWTVFIWHVLASIESRISDFNVTVVLASKRHQAGKGINRHNVANLAGFRLDASAHVHYSLSRLVASEVAELGTVELGPNRRLDDQPVAAD